MKKLFGMAVLALGLVLTGAPTVMAGGTSDASGDGFHCYLFFSLPDERFAQAIINDSDLGEVTKKCNEFRDKYEGEGGTLYASMGNVAACFPESWDEGEGGAVKAFSWSQYMTGSPYFLLRELQGE